MRPALANSARAAAVDNTTDEVRLKRLRKLCKLGKRA
jgi:hypothetical protein